VSVMLYDDEDEGKEKHRADLCEWCGLREAEEDHVVFGLGRLRLCEECATMLLASIMDSG
jgi:hypothetical protein